MPEMINLAERISGDPEQCGGRPCVRGMRIPVSDVLDLLADGLTPKQIIEELPDLEPEDVAACLRFASRRLDHPVLGVSMKNEFTAIIERDGEWFIAYCAEIPGANGQGRTKEEARENLAQAIELILYDRREDALRGIPPDAIQETVTVK
jgi:uncharacterized protein (DUF433 family)/predicted RNase H-like HicB family nuclease